MQKMKRAREAAGLAGAESFERITKDEQAQPHAILRKLAGYED